MVQIWNLHITSFLGFSGLGTCTDCPRTHRAPNNKIRKHLLRQRNYYASFYLPLHICCVHLARDGPTNSDFFRKVPTKSKVSLHGLYNYLLYRQECFTGKYTARKIHTKLHPGPEWRIFHVLTSEDIDDVISHSFTVVCANSR